MKRRLILAAAFFAVLYLVGVIATGLGWNPFGRLWNFENSGQFGDSFGPLGALMSAIAAVSALMAYWSQREELGELKKAEKINQVRSDKKDFEDTFFRLLSLFREILNQVEHKIEKQGRGLGEPPITKLHKRGSYALESMMMWSSLGSHQKDRHEVAKLFMSIYDAHQGSMGHYFRLFYHILKFVDEANVEDKKKYARFLRALLSRSEILLIALNCAHGGGKEKLKPLVEKYAMLHNISASEAKRLHLLSEFPQAAFGDRSLESELEHSD